MAKRAAKTKTNKSGKTGDKLRERGRGRSPRERGPAAGDEEGPANALVSPAPSSAAEPGAEESFDLALAGLNDKQAQFVREYLISPNASEAARRAGYSAKTAGVQAHDLLKKPEIQAALSAGKLLLQSRFDVTLERVVGELAAMALGDASDIAVALDDKGEPITINNPADIAKLPPPLRKMIAGWSYDRNGNFVLRFHDKRGALETLGKHVNLGGGDGGADVAAALVEAMRAGMRRAKAPR